MPLELPWVSWLGPERYIRKSMFVYSVSDTHFGVLGASLDPLGSFWNLLELIWGLLGPLWASLLGPERSVRQGLSVYSANQEATKGYWPTETSSTHDFQLRS